MAFCTKREEQGAYQRRRQAADSQVWYLLLRLRVSLCRDARILKKGNGFPSRYLGEGTRDPKFVGTRTRFKKAILLPEAARAENAFRLCTPVTLGFALCSVFRKYPSQTYLSASSKQSTACLSSAFWIRILKHWTCPLAAEKKKRHFTSTSQRQYKCVNLQIWNHQTCRTTYQLSVSACSYKCCRELK